MRTRTTYLLTSLFFFSLIYLVHSNNSVLYLNTAQDIINFSSQVNQGKNFFDTTVYLNNDIEFTDEELKQFAPIGIHYSALLNSTNKTYFNGVFDGNGYVIRNFRIVSAYSDAGFLGYSTGETVRNIVMDSSCSITSNYTGDLYTYVGGIISGCYSHDFPCVMEGLVNMANVTFIGKFNERASIVGGVIGETGPYLYGTTIANCVNRGTVSFYGETKTNGYAGGVVGKIAFTSGGKCTIKNCVNFGKVIVGGTTEGFIAFGGITSFSEPGVNLIENCVDMGIMVNDSSKANLMLYAGSIIGRTDNNTVKNCYWNDGNVYGGVNIISGTGRVSNIYMFNESLMLNNSRSLIDVLNENSPDSTQWYLLEYHCNGGHLLNFPGSEVVKTVEIGGLVPPTPVKENNAFIGWYIDESLKTPANVSVNGSATLYAKYGWTITFNTTGGTEIPPLIFECNEIIIINSTMTGYTPTWTASVETKAINSTAFYVPNCDVMFTAHWIPNNYTVSFDLGNGTVINETFTYGYPIKYPDNITREAYIFNGWSTNTTNMPAENIIITAQWVKGTLYIETTIYSPSMIESEVIETIQKYTDAPFTIERFEYDEKAGTTKVIIKFEDLEEAAKFVNTARNDNTYSMEVIPIYEIPRVSYSHILCPFIEFLIALAFTNLVSMLFI